MKFKLHININIIESKENTCLSQNKNWFNNDNILTFISWINFMLSGTEHEKSVINSVPGLSV